MVVLFALSVVMSASCKKQEDPTPVASSATADPAPATDESATKDTIVEDHDGGSVAWTIAKDGQAKALVTTSGDAKPAPTGTLVWKAGGTEPAKTIPMTADANGALVAAGPALTADITEIDYTLAVGEKAWSGVLQVPPGGTAELVSDAKVSAAIDVPDGKVGPHGGKIQIVGSDRLEIVSDASGEVRVYVLDVDFKPVVVGERKVTLAVVAERPEVVVLAPEAGGLYFTGMLHVREDPVKLTISIRVNEHVNVALCGWHPGAHVVVFGPAPPRVAIHTKVAFNVHADARAHVEEPNVHVNVHAPSVKVKVGGGDDDDHGKHKGGKKH